MRLVFCGNPEFAVPTLAELLASRHEVLAVVTSPDKPRGRGQKLEPLPVKAKAIEASVPVLQPQSLKDSQFLEQIKSLNPDVLIVIAFRILPRELFVLPKFGSLNVHPSLLPKGRGPAPIQWTLLRGETETGISIIRLTEKIDGGQILKQVTTPIEPFENFGMLHDRFSHLGAKLLLEVLNLLESNRLPQPIEQDESLVTSARKLHAEDYKIHWTKSAFEIQNQIRAFSPRPGAFTQKDSFRLKILESTEVTNETSLSAGETIVENEEFLVGTSKGILALKEIQPEGKKAMKVAEFLRGRPQIPRFLES